MPAATRGEVGTRNKHNEGAREPVDHERARFARADAKKEIYAAHHDGGDKSKPSAAFGVDMSQVAEGFGGDEKNAPDEKPHQNGLSNRKELPSDKGAEEDGDEYLCGVNRFNDGEFTDAHRLEFRDGRESEQDAGGEKNAKVFRRSKKRREILPDEGEQNDRAENIDKEKRRPVAEFASASLDEKVADTPSKERGQRKNDTHTFSILFIIRRGFYLKNSRNFIGSIEVPFRRTVR